MNEIATINKSLDIRDRIGMAEEALSQMPNVEYGNDGGELKHTFADGTYIRQITMLKGTLLTSRIHKIEHPYFVMKGECSVLTEEGSVKIKAPYWGITKPGTKRLIYIHEDTVWITVHAMEKKDLKDIEDDITFKTYDEVDRHKAIGEV